MIGPAKEGNRPPMWKVPEKKQERQQSRGNGLQNRMRYRSVPTRACSTSSGASAGGLVAVLENDTMHQLFLPWPVSLELPLRATELRSFLGGSRNSSKYCVGWRLPAILAAAGLEPLQMIAVYPSS